jgi:protein-tyrosine phosphatase
MVNVLFVCTGNICRSPSAEGMFRNLVEREGLGERIGIDSAGTHAYHIDEPPDHRSQEAARLRGIDLSGLRGRKADPEDFHRFDYVLAMDSENHSDLMRICPPGAEERLHMFLDFAPDLGEREVPDPYYGGVVGFDVVLDFIEAASQGLLDHIRERHL